MHREYSLRERALWHEAARQRAARRAKAREARRQEALAVARCLDLDPAICVDLVRAEEAPSGLLRRIANEGVDL